MNIEKEKLNLVKRENYFQKKLNRAKGVIKYAQAEFEMKFPIKDVFLA